MQCGLNAPSACHFVTMPHRLASLNQDCQTDNIKKSINVGGQGRRQASISSTASCIAASAPTCSDATGAERLALLNHNTRGYMTA